MTYLDDGSRVRIKADVAALITAPPMAATGVSAPAREARAALSRQASRPPANPAGANAPEATMTSAGPDRSALAQGGDPYLPPALRVAPTGPSPSGASLKALVERKISERNADVYR